MGSFGRRVALVFLLALVVLVPGIGVSYWGRDEADYAGVAHAMNATGDYLVPRLFGRLFADKPPLAEWLTALSFRVLGEWEWAGRLPHVLLASGCAVLVLLLGERMLGARGGTAAAVFFATSLLFVVYGRLLLTDSALLFFTLLSIVGFARILAGRGGSKTAAGAGAALGLAVLSKGPVAFLSPGLFCFGFLAGGAQRSARTLLRLFLALAVCLAVAAPWFWLTAQATGGAAARSFWLRENVGRFLAPMQGHRAPALSVLLAAWLGFFPWSGALLGLFRPGLLRRRPEQWGLLAWAGGVLLFFALARTKLPHYILPALPALALLVAGGFPLTAARLRAAAWACALTGAGVFLAGVAAVTRAGDARAVRILIPLGAACLLSLLLPLVRSEASEAKGLRAAAILASAAIAWGTVPAIDSLRSTGRLGLAARGARRDAEPVGGLHIDEPVLTYYAGPPTQPWKNAAEIGRAAADSPAGTALVWLDSAESPALARGCRCRVQVLDRGPSLADPRVRGELALVRVSRAGEGPR
ncbi:MAG TPA: glycosyltransferase family 39 protein [Thermoanaerobaculia bacterium]|nr:glycosyltransferase family 39 protein [Thermoanaerobaculia bacterium]